MSDRSRRSESSWDRKEAGNEIIELSSNGDSPKRLSEVNDVFMSDDFTIQATENLLMDDDNIGEKHRMNDDPAFDEWDGQYREPYRGASRAAGGKDRARSRSRSRSWSPHRTRDRDRDQDITRPQVQDFTHPRDQDLTRPRDLDRDRGQDRDEDINRHWDQDITRHRDHDMIRSRDLDRARPRDWDRGRPRGLERSRSRSRSRSRGREQSRATSPSRGGGFNRLDDDSTKKWSNNRPEYEYSSGSQYHRTHKSGYSDQDHRRQPNQNIKPCKFFIMGRCNRDNCRFSHDLPNSNPNLDDKNTHLGSNQEFRDKNTHLGSNQEFRDKNTHLGNNKEFRDKNTHLGNNQESRFIPDNSDSGDGPTRQLNGSVNVDEKPLEASRSDNLASSLHQISQNLNLVNALGLIYSGGPVDSAVVNMPVKAKAPVENQPVKAKAPVENQKSTEVAEKKVAEKSKVDEGNTGNDEKAMRAFKNALVEFVKEILKPTWKEGKMSREVHKTIVKKVVEKVTSTVQGNQIPRTQEKTDQYLAFSKAKITKLVEAYVGRLVKGA